jgi:hypothetical protein
MGIAKVPQGTKRHDGPNGIVRPPLDVALGKEKPPSYANCSRWRDWPRMRGVATAPNPVRAVGSSEGSTNAIADRSDFDCQTTE